jgi:hypothetical protein
MLLTERDCHEVFVYEPSGRLQMVLVYEGIMSDYEEGVIRLSDTYISNHVLTKAIKDLAGGGTMYTGRITSQAERFWQVMLNSELTVDHKFYNIKIRRSINDEQQSDSDTEIKGRFTSIYY